MTKRAAVTNLEDLDPEGKGKSRHVDSDSENEAVNCIFDTAGL